MLPKGALIMDRRTFLKSGTVGAMAAATGLGTASYSENTVEQAVSTSDIVYRTLGRTKLKVSVVGVGAMRTSEPAVLQATFDKGVNYLDTAHCYMNGNNERIVGRALKGYRDKVILATKVHIGSKDEMINSVNDSLKSLQTDHIDIIQLHSMSSKTQGHESETKEALAELKKQGKVRFTGVTTHKNEVDVINGVVEDEDKFYDMVLVAYNFKSSDELKQSIERAAKAKIGIVGMKTQAGGYKTKELGDISPHQASLKWVLQDTNVHTTIPSMVNLEQIKEDTEVMSLMKLTSTDKQILYKYGKAIEPYYCHRCGDCESTCPMGIDICDINRCLMYAEGYGDVELAKSNYTNIPSKYSASVCGDCEECVAMCPKGLNIPSKMKQARILFS